MKVPDNYIALPDNMDEIREGCTEVGACPVCYQNFWIKKETQESIAYWTKEKIIKLGKLPIFKLGVCGRCNSGITYDMGFFSAPKSEITHRSIKISDQPF